jgi:hypothetical protein
MLSFLFITEVTISHVLNVTNRIDGTAKESVSVARHSIYLTFVLFVKGVLLQSACHLNFSLQIPRTMRKHIPANAYVRWLP